MKKYITIIALLAAGVAFANAAQPAGIASESTLWTMNFGVDVDGTNDYKITSEGFEFAPTGVWDVNDLVDSNGLITGAQRAHFQGNTGVTWGDDFKFSITFTLGNNEGTITASNNWPVVATLTDSNYTNNVRFGPYVGNNNYVNLDGNSASAFEKTSQNLVTLSAGVEYVADLYVIDGLVSLYIDGVLASQGKLNANDYTANKEVNNIMIGGGVHNAYLIHEHVTTISMTKLSMVPEPSTFGLLAGLGALALVGTRRRRR